MATTPTIGTITIEMESPSVLRTVKTLLRQIKGVSSVKVAQKPRVKFTKEELMARIDRADEDLKAGNCICMQENETAEDFINRMLCATM